MAGRFSAPAVRHTVARIRLLVASGALAVFALHMTVGSGPAATGPGCRGAPGKLQGLTVGRRGPLLSAALLAAAAPGQVRADEGRVDFNLRLPSTSWRVKTEMKQAIRIRKERVFDAEEPSKKASVVITRTPLGASRTDSDRRESIMDLAGAFDPKRKVELSKEAVVQILTKGFDEPAARRERQWIEVRRVPGIEEYQDASGQRYVRFAYETQECTGPVTQFTRYDGAAIEDCDGRVMPWKRHYTTATVMATKYTSMRSSYLDGSEGQRSRFVESLWLLDASAPVKKADGPLGSDLDSIARSFTVPLPDMTEYTEG